MGTCPLTAAQLGLMKWIVHINRTCRDRSPPPAHHRGLLATLDCVPALPYGNYFNYESWM